MLNQSQIDGMKIIYRQMQLLAKYSIFSEFVCMWKQPSQL